jgi:hypothetical protein
MSTYKARLRRFEYTDVLGWSYSRYSTFQQCKRKYYYEYYGKYDVANTPRINFLKSLTTIPLEIGNISHKLIERLLVRLQRSPDPIDLEKFYDYAERQTHEICAQKEFEDIHYKLRDSIDFKIEVYEHVSKAMENFLKSERMRWLLTDALENKEEWVIEFDDQNKFGECRIDEQKAYCKVDFMFPIQDDLHIIDWKTGKEDYVKHSTQLKGYAGWANFQFDTDYEKIKPTVAYLLPEYKENSIVLNAYDIDDFSSQIKRQTDDMYQYCDDPHTNRPLPKEEFKLTVVENFCKRCKYRELCERV